MTTPPGRSVRVLRLNGHMGDVLMSLPVLRAFRRAHPRDRIHYLVQPKYQPILAGNRDIDFLRPLGKMKGTPGHVDLADFSGRPWASKWRHVVDAMGDACGVSVEDRSYRMVIPGDDSRWAEKEAAALGRFAVLHSSSALPSKDWPIDRFGRLAKRLMEFGIKLVQVGLNDDAGIPCAGIVDHRGALSVSRSAALMERAALFVGVDSGPMHLSQASRAVPAVVFWGAGSPVTTGIPGQAVANLDPPRFCHHGGRPCHSRCDWTSMCVGELAEEDAFLASARLLGHAPKGPEISIVLVNWNSWVKSTHPMVSRIDRTLSGGPSIELVIVDNGSGQDEQTAIRTLRRPYPVCSRIWPSNRGLPAAWNEALRLATGGIIGFMNTDLDLDPGWDRFVCDFFLRNPNAEVLGLSLNEPPMTFGPGLARERLALERGRTTLCHHMIGSCFFARRSALDRVGAFDLRYSPAYCEDTDWFLKASLMGAQIWHHAGFVRHRGHEVTVDINKCDLGPLIAANNAYFASKWAGAEPAPVPPASAPVLPLPEEVVA